jgi:hypothetical protein
MRLYCTIYPGNIRNLVAILNFFYGLKLENDWHPDWVRIELKTGYESWLRCTYTVHLTQQLRLSSLLKIFCNDLQDARAYVGVAMPGQPRCSPPSRD